MDEELFGGESYEVMPAESAPTPVKPGVYSTEFWLTAGTTLVAALVAFGVVNVSERAGLESAVAQAVEGAFALAAAGAVVWRYIVARQAAKGA